MICILLCSSGLALSAGRGVTSPNPMPIKPLHQKQAEEDFDLLRLALEEAHPGLYRYTSKAEMDRVFARERSKLGRSVGRVALLRVVAETLAKIRCGHTFYDADASLHQAMVNARKLPFSLQLEGKRLVVVLNQSTDDTIRPGMEIVEIDGHSAEEVVAAVWPLLPGDGDIPTGRSRQMRHLEQFYWLLYGPANRFVIRSRGADGKTHIAWVDGITDAEREKSDNPLNGKVMTGFRSISWTRDNLALRFLRDPTVAELHIGYFVGDDFADKLQSAFKTLGAC